MHLDKPETASKSKGKKGKSKKKKNNVVESRMEAKEAIKSEEVLRCIRCDFFVDERKVEREMHDIIYRSKQIIQQAKRIRSRDFDGLRYV